MNKFGLVVAMGLLLSACGLGASGNSLEDQVARVEAGYNAALRIVIEARRPCVDDDLTNDDRCFIDDELYETIDRAVDAADGALDKAHDYAAANDSENVGVWLNKFKEDFSSVENIVETIREKL